MWQPMRYTSHVLSKLCFRRYLFWPTRTTCTWVTVVCPLMWPFGTASAYDKLLSTPGLKKKNKNTLEWGKFLLSCVCNCMCVSIICMCMCMCVCVCVCVYTYLSYVIYVCVCVYTCLSCVYDIYVCGCLWFYVCMCVYVWCDMYVCVSALIRPVW